jgi:hypothetical protein
MMVKFLRLFIAIFVALIFTFVVSEQVQAASFTVDPEVVSTEAGEEFSVDVSIDTGGKKTDGADLVLKFNAEKLEVLRVDPGVVYSDYPIQETGDGVVKVTGISSQKGPFFEGEGVFATIVFKVLYGGEEFIKVDFEDGSTTDSNVAFHGKGTDILSEVGGSILYISGPEKQESFINTSAAGKILIVLVYLIIVVIVGFFAYRWWVKKTREQDIFIPEKAPLDRPPGPDK